LHEIEDHGKILLRSGRKENDYESTTTMLKSVSDIDYNDKDAVMSEVNNFMDEYAYANVEHAIVITTTNKVYNMTGGQANVDISIIGAKELKDSITVHNHPLIYDDEEKDDSFSKDDIKFYLTYQTDTNYLTSGTRREMMRYKGDKTYAEIYDIYIEARYAVLERQRDAVTRSEYEQEEINKELAKRIRGFEFYEI
jgi:hypothetical protein